MKPKPLNLKELESDILKCLKAQNREDITVMSLLELFKSRNKSAVEWYSCYADCPKLLIMDYPKYKSIIPRLKTSYNLWLLKKAFQDVMKKGE